MVDTDAPGQAGDRDAHAVADPAGREARTSRRHRGSSQRPRKRVVRTVPAAPTRAARPRRSRARSELDPRAGASRTSAEGDYAHLVGKGRAAGTDEEAREHARACGGGDRARPGGLAHRRRRPSRPFGAALRATGARTGRRGDPSRVRPLAEARPAPDPVGPGAVDEARAHDEVPGRQVSRARRGSPGIRARGSSGATKLSRPVGGAVDAEVRPAQETMLLVDRFPADEPPRYMPLTFPSTGCGARPSASRPVRARSRRPRVVDEVVADGGVVGVRDEDAGAVEPPVVARCSCGSRCPRGASRRRLRAARTTCSG